MPQDLITVPAIQIEQLGKVFYATSFTVGDFMRDDLDFYRINKLDATKESGYQRYLDERRANRIAADVAEAWKAEALFLPTSLFLATTHNIECKNGELRFKASEVCPFDVVDGQHRIKGLIAAAEKNRDIESFPVAVNIAANMPEPYQRLHFYIVNTKQKSVDAGVAQQIVARFSKDRGFVDMPYLPNGLRRMVRKNLDRFALDIVKHLNTATNSPWRGRILMADKAPKRGGQMVRQQSFVTVLKQMVLTANHALFSYDDQRNRMLENYWRAIVNVLVPDGEEDNSVVLKNNGVWFFHRISSGMFSWLEVDQDFRVATIERKLRAAFEHLDEDVVGEIPEPRWWLATKRGDKSGASSAGRLNRAALLDRAKKMNEAIIAARGNGGSGIRL